VIRVWSWILRLLNVRIKILDYKKSSVHNGNALFKWHGGESSWNLRRGHRLFVVGHICNLSYLRGGGRKNLVQGQSGQKCQTYLFFFHMCIQC
jgi:hypothetical protein